MFKKEEIAVIVKNIYVTDRSGTILSSVEDIKKPNLGDRDFEFLFFFGPHPLVPEGQS